MKKIFTCIAAVFAALALNSCSKSTESYEALYYILLSGPQTVTVENDQENYYKQMIETALSDWKQNTKMTWRIDFGKSYSDADVAAKDAEAVAYFRNSVEDLRGKMYNVIIAMENNGSRAIVHASWHLSICRDRSKNPLTTSTDVYLDHGSSTNY